MSIPATNLCSCADSLALAESETYTKKERLLSGGTTFSK
jgi:hypothetical protein